VPRPVGSSEPSYPAWSAALASTQCFEPATFRSALSRILRRDCDEPQISAAVLVGFFDLDGEVGIVLTRRAATMRTDPLTVSFPGGRLEADETPLEAAIREAEEEIGLASSMIEVLGSLDAVDRRSNTERILPVVCWLHRDFTAVANPAEVEAVLEVPLRSLLEVGAAWSEEWGDGVESRTIRFFAHPGVLGADLVWGLTARVIWELIERVCVSAENS